MMQVLQDHERIIYPGRSHGMFFMEENRIEARAQGLLQNK